MDARDLVGVILAGGASSRMGRPKEAILLQGEPLLQRQQRLLFEVGVRRVLLAMGKAHRADPPYRSGPADGADRPPHPRLLPGMRGEVVHDPPGSGGPLAGIVAGLRRIQSTPPDRLSAGGLVVLAVDMPQLEGGLLRELVHAAGPGLGAAPRVDGRWEPLAAIYPREALEPAERLLAGSASPSALLDELLASGGVQALDVPSDQGAGLRSWNTPEDLPRGGGPPEVRRPLGHAAVHIEPVAATSPEAQWCLARYFDELGHRFEDGFDPGESTVADPREFDPPRGAFLVGTVDGRPVACGALKLLPGPVGYIKRMWVDDTVRGLGLGRRLLAALESTARDLGGQVVQLETNRVLSEAIRLYRSEGYREVPPFNDERYAHHWFEKALTDS